jgi:hypothetical protein
MRVDDLAEPGMDDLLPARHPPRAAAGVARAFGPLPLISERAVHMPEL